MSYFAMRVLQSLFALLVLVIVLALGSAVWLVKSESGLNFALNQASQWLPKALEDIQPSLQFSAAQGSAWDGFSIDQLVWSSEKRSEQTTSNETMRVTVRRLEVQLNWPALWQEQVQFERLKAESVEVRTPQELASVQEAETAPAKPLSMPESIRLPVSVAIGQFFVGRLEANAQVIEGIQAELKVENDVLSIDRLVLAHESGELTAFGSVGLQQPFNGKLEAALSRRDSDGFVYKADVNLAGNFEVLTLAAKASAELSGQQAQIQTLNAQALVTLLKPVKVQSVELDMASFDPSKWFAEAPKARLNAQLDLKPNATFTQSVGNLEVHNSQPSSVQKGGLPVGKLKAEFVVAQTASQQAQLGLTIRELALADTGGSAGLIKGRLSWLGQLPESNLDNVAINRLGDWDIELNAQNLRLAAFVSVVSSARLNGEIELRKRQDEFDLQRLQISDGLGRIQAQGTLSANGQWDSQAQVSFFKLQPESYLRAYLPELTGNLNGRLNWQGRLRRATETMGPDMLNGLTGISRWEPEGKLSVVLDQSTLAQAPLRLNAQVQGRLDRIKALELQAAVMENTLLASGAYGGRNDVIQWQADAQHLDRLGALLGIGLSGSLAMEGQLTGTGLAVSTDFTVKARDLEFLNMWRVRQVDGSLRLGLEQDAAWEGDIQVASLSQIQGDEDWVRSLSLSLTGSRKRHALNVTFESDLKPFSRRRALSGLARIQGGWRNKDSTRNSQIWLGRVQALQIAGLWRPLRSLSLKQPFDVQLGSSEVRMSAFELLGEDPTRIRSEQVQIAGQRVLFKGAAPHFSMPRLSSLLKRPVTLETDELVTRWNWSLVANSANLDGHLDVGHVSGGFRILEDSEIKVPVNDFEAEVDFTRKNVTARANLDVAQVGVVSGEVKLPVAKDPATGQWGVEEDGPIQGDLAAGLSDLSWLGPLLSPAFRSDGEGYVALALSGTAAAPQLAGRVIGRDLELTELDQGMRFEEGEVIVDFDNDQARLEMFAFNVYHRQAPARRLEELGPLIQGVGRVSANGQWNLSGFNGRFDLSLDRVALIQRPDRWLMVSADLNLAQPQTEGEAIRVRGDVLAHGAYIEMPKSGPQTLGNDVVIRGQTVAAPASSPIDVQVNAKLGDLFFVNAEGLRSRLAGGLSLSVQEGGASQSGRGGRRLEARGTIQAVDGTYRAYGQDLTIERGVVNFQGPLSNPGLNVRAVRKGGAVEAGVEITGSVNRPQVALVSDPPVPDSEKLSWMIIGRGSNSSDRDTTLLLTAAAALFGDDSDDSTTLKIARSLGVDDFAFSSGSLTAADSRAVGSQVAISPGADASAAVLGDEDPLLTQRLITLGKRLNREFYLSFEQSVTTSANVVKLTYQYSRRLSFIARGGADNAVDMLYQFSFD